jgi:hypothetical protein
MRNASAHRNGPGAHRVTGWPAVVAWWRRWWLATTPRDIEQAARERRTRHRAS